MKHYTPIDSANIGALITVLRTEAKMNQTELGRRLGVSVSAVSLWESGDRVPALKTFFDIMSVFNKQIYYVNQ